MPSAEHDGAEEWGWRRAGAGQAVQVRTCVRLHDVEEMRWSWMACQSCAFPVAGSAVRQRGASEPLPLCTMFISPLYTRYDDTCPPKLFRYYMRRKMGPPGGAVCVGAKDLASCERFD